MNWIYVIQDKERAAIAATFDEGKAIQMCRCNKEFSYREIPFISTSAIEVTIKAGPISEEYLQKGSLPKQQ